LQFTPDDNGTYRFVLTAADGDGGAASAETTITVANVAPTPAIGSVSGALLEGSTLTVTGSATDPGAHDAITLTWSVYKNGGSATDPAGANDPVTLSGAVYKNDDATAYAAGSRSTLQFTPDDNGTYRVVLTADDGDGGVATAQTVVAVANVAPAPAIRSVSGSLLEGSTVAVAGSATDPGVLDAVALSWAVYKNGGSAAYASGSGSSLQFTPDDNGTYRVVLTAADGDGGAASAETTINVANVAPQNVSAGPDQTVTAGATVNLTGSFIDPGALDADTFAWTVAASNGQT